MATVAADGECADGAPSIPGAVGGRLEMQRFLRRGEVCSIGRSQNSRSVAAGWSLNCGRGVVFGRKNIP